MLWEARGGEIRIQHFMAPRATAKCPAGVRQAEFSAPHAYSGRVRSTATPECRTDMLPAAELTPAVTPAVSRKRVSILSNSILRGMLRLY